MRGAMLSLKCVNAKRRIGMYCKFCGKQIDDDSAFCAHCGKKIISINNEQESEQSKSIPSEPTETKKETALWGAWLLLPFFAILLVVIIAVASDASGSGTASKDLRSSDYTYTTSQDLTSYSITVTPERDIRSCDIQLALYNSKGEKLFSDTISKNNLEKGRSYTYTFDFGFVNSLTGNKVNYSISGKRK